MPQTFAVDGNNFLLNGKPFRVLSGAVHYFRVPREYWRDRLTKLKACGFNTVETYVAWNIHEEEEGCFSFQGEKDIAEFLRIAQELGLYAIVRPGPYICSEWEFGGLPWWLLKKDGIVLRCDNEPYLSAVFRFFDKLIPLLAPLQITHGGNIIMMQVENEYGSYGDDKVYLKKLEDKMRSLDIDVPLFTSDGATDFMLTGGTLPHLLKTANFGSRAANEFGKLRERQPVGPLMCCEFWNGWFDHWGEAHHSRSPEDAGNSMQEILDLGGSLSCYMFHGGTNFELMNGANFSDKYEPTVSSYDDDAPLDESGRITPKYRVFRNILAKYHSEPLIDVPEEIPSKAYGEVPFTESAYLLKSLNQLSTPIHSASPMTMEELGIGYGFVLYHSHIAGPREELPLILDEVHDRAHVFVDGKFAGIQSRTGGEPEIKVAVSRQGCDIDILVENMGRVNYGPHLTDRKGITSGIRLGNTFLYHWDHYPLPMTNLQSVAFSSGIPAWSGLPMLLRGNLKISETPSDTFVKLPGFKKGLIFVNGKILSRYWHIGPQHSAYLPAPFLHKGDNEIVVLELDGFSQGKALFDSKSDLG